jgi:hypothetical protein
MYTLLSIGVVVLILLIHLVIGFFIWRKYKKDIKEIIQFYKQMKPELPSFKKTTVDIKNLLSELKKQKNNLNK